MMILMDYLNLYANFLKKYLKPKRKLKVVCDCSNGTTGTVLKKLFPKAIFLNEKPNGNFPGHGPNPMTPGAIKQLQKAVLKQKADLGAIFDADGDRIFFVDDLGRVVSPDETGLMLLQELKPKKFVIGPIAGQLLKNSRFFVSKVGHYFFKKLMREKNIPLGVEHSGHYYFSSGGGSASGGRSQFYFDSGILAAIHIINFISKLNQPVSKFLDKLPKYYRSGEINFKLKAKNEKLKTKILEKTEKFYRKHGAKLSKLDGLTVEFKDWWLSLRSSNTENLLRLNLEAKTKKILNQELKRIRRLIKTK